MVVQTNKEHYIFFYLLISLTDFIQCIINMNKMNIPEMLINPKKKASKKRVSLARNSYSLSILKHLVRSSITVLEKREVIFNDVYEQIINELKSPCRNQLKLYLLLQSYPKFKFFLNSYNIPQRAMIECLQDIKLYKFRPDEHVFNLGDKSDNFYIIIKGNVIVKELVLKGDGYIIRDKLRLFTGDCFGETAVLYDLPRSNTIVSETETSMLGIPKQVFIINLKSIVLRGKREKREQICALIPILAELPFRQFIQIYKTFVFLSVKKCSYIFKEGDKAEAFYLLTNGRGKLTKGEFHLLTIGKNCLTGFEAVDYLEFDNEVKYETSLIAIDDCSVIKIRTALLGRIYEKFIALMKEMKIGKDLFIQSMYNKAKSEKEKFTFDYKEKQIRNKIKEYDKQQNENRIIKREYKSFCKEEERNKQFNLKYRKVNKKMVLVVKDKDHQQSLANTVRSSKTSSIKPLSKRTSRPTNPLYRTINTTIEDDEHILFEKKMNPLFITTNPFDESKRASLRLKTMKTLPTTNLLYTTTLSSNLQDQSVQTICGNNSSDKVVNGLFADTSEDILNTVNKWKHTIRTRCGFDTGKYQIPLLCLGNYKE